MAPPIPQPITPLQENAIVRSILCGLEKTFQAGYCRCEWRKHQKQDSNSHSPAQIPLAGCDHKGRQNRLLDAYLPPGGVATLVIATCYADLKPRGPPEGFLTTALRNCAFARALRGPTFSPNAQKGPQSSTPGPKGTPKRTPNVQIRPKRKPKKDLERPTLQDGT